MSDTDVRMLSQHVSVGRGVGCCWELLSDPDVLLTAAVQRTAESSRLLAHEHNRLPGAARVRFSSLIPRARDHPGPSGTFALLRHPLERLLFLQISPRTLL